MLGESATRRIFFLRELRKHDREGVLWDERFLRVPEDAREGDEVGVIDRCFRKAERLVHERGGIDPAPYYKPMGDGPWWWLWVLAFVLGLSANYLGKTDTVHLLRTPLMALLLFNLCAYLLIAVLFLRGGTPGNWLWRWGNQLLGRMGNLGAGQLSEPVVLLRRVRIAFRIVWHSRFPQLATWKLAGRLHGGAAALMLGAVSGLYLRGLVRSYTFVWDSTFIVDPAFQKRILGLLFAPVLWGREIPALGSPEGGAAWINLLAIAGLTYVVVPRLGLSWLAHRTARKKANALKLDLTDSLFNRMLASASALEPYVTLVGYSYRLEDRQQALLDAAREVWGDRLRLNESHQLAWGDNALLLKPREGRKNVVLAVFPGAQTPEEEVHVPIAKALLTSANQAGLYLVILVDSARVPEDGAARRRRAWGEVMGEAGIARIAWGDVGGDVKTLAAAVADAVIMEGLPRE